MKGRFAKKEIKENNKETRKSWGLELRGQQRQRQYSQTEMEMCVGVRVKAERFI